MEVIPAINCGDEACVKKHLEMLKDIPAEWVHFDVSDGKFTPAKTWDVPERFFEVQPPMEVEPLKRKVEVHLMVERPEEYVERWVGVGARRVIVHIETISGRSDLPKEVGPQVGVQVGLALRLETPVEQVFSYLDKVRFVQLLAVRPGFSGQKFDERILDKVRALRAKDPHVIIEVDGGISLEVAARAKEVGANVIVSSSFIWNHVSPREAFLSLKKIL